MIDVVTMKPFPFIASISNVFDSRDTPSHILIDQNQILHVFMVESPSEYIGGPEFLYTSFQFEMKNKALQETMKRISQHTNIRFCKQSQKMVPHTTSSEIGCLDDF